MAEKSILAAIDLGNFTSQVINEKRPVLVACLEWENGVEEQIEILENVSRTSNGNFKVCFLNKNFAKIFMERYHIAEIPSYLIFEKGEEKFRMLGNIEAEALRSFLLLQI